jgi:two-component system sensor histidine kinase RpfC
MNLGAALRARLSARSDCEHVQASVRVVIIGLITAFMWGRSASSAAGLVGDDKLLLLGLAGFFMLATGIFVAIWIWPAVNVPRRALGILADAAAISFALFLAGESGVGLVSFYLLIIFGNGFRYGRRYLFKECLERNPREVA